MVGNYLLITLSLKCETTCSSGIGRPFPRVIRIAVITTLSRNGSICLIYKTVEFILMNIYMNRKKYTVLFLHHHGWIFNLL